MTTSTKTVVISWCCSWLVTHRHWDLWRVFLILILMMYGGISIEIIGSLCVCVFVYLFGLVCYM